MTAPRYQKDKNVFDKKITKEYDIFKKMFSDIPKDMRVLDIACAEGFIAYIAAKCGHKATGIEITPEKVSVGKKQFDTVSFVCGDIFKNLKIIDEHEVFVISRFFHNVGYDLSMKLLARISIKNDFMVIVRYKPGAIAENGKPRKPLATKKGVGELLSVFDMAKKSFPGEVIVAARGDMYVKILQSLAKKYGK